MHKLNHHFFGTTTIGAKGQTVIPMEARKELDLKQGEKLLVFGGKKHAIILVKLDGAQRMISALAARIDSIKKVIRSK